MKYFVAIKYKHRSIKNAFLNPIFSSVDEIVIPDSYLTLKNIIEERNITKKHNKGNSSKGLPHSLEAMEDVTIAHDNRSILLPQCLVAVHKERPMPGPIKIFRTLINSEQKLFSL